MLGDDHIDVQCTAYNLGRDLRELGEAEAARQLSEDTLTRARRVFGDEHPRTLKATHHLAAAQRMSSAAEPARHGDPDPPDG
jgi:hypothetical protein